MNRQERLKFCKTCQKREFDFNKGILCGLTHEFADFEESCPDYEQDQKIQILETYKKDKNEEKLKLLQEKKEKKKEKRKNRKKKKVRIPEKISLSDIYLILGSSFLTVFFVRLFAYASFYQSIINFNPVTLISIFILFTTTLLLRKKESGKYKVFGDLKFKLIYSALFSLIYLLYTLIVMNDNTYILALLILVFLASFILSLLSVIIVIPASLLTRKLKRKAGFNKYLLLSGFVLILFIAILEADFFIKKGVKVWEAGSSVTESDFRGYPNYLTQYDAAISSKFVYNINGKSIDSVDVKTEMYQHHSWIKKSVIASDYLLRHEQYHFNISEIIARKFKQNLILRSNNSFNEKSIKEQYIFYLRELNYLQDKYDEDAKHSIDIEKQKDWEYMVDSMLSIYTIYSADLSEIPGHKNSTPQYCRQIHEDGRYNIIPKNPVDSATARYCNHYKLNYSNGRLVEISYYHGTEPAIDNYFETHKTSLKTTEEGISYQFFDIKGNHVKNRHGVYSKTLDFRNDKIILSFQDSIARPMSTYDGIHRIEWETDSKGRKSSGLFYNLEGKRTVDEFGNSSLIYQYDQKGNILEIANFDDGLKRVDNHEGIAFTRYLYDARNNPVRIRRFNSKNHPAVDRNNIAEEIYAYDLMGNIVMVCYKNELGQTLKAPDGTAIAYFKYDEFSNLIEQKHYGYNKNLIISEEGIGYMRMQYDSIGRITEKTNYDAYDHPLNDADNKCKVSYVYEEGPKPVKENLFFYTDSNSIQFLKTIEYIYNDAGKVILETYSDDEGNLYADSTGIVYKSYKYDNKNRLIEIVYLDKNKKATAFLEDACRVCYAYDMQNNQTEAAFYDNTGKLTATKNEIARETAKYNNHNKRIEAAYYGTDNQPVKNGNNVEVVKWEYDQANRISKESYFSSSGIPVCCIEGYARRDFEYTTDNSIAYIRHYDADNQPADEGPFQVYEIYYEYNESGYNNRILYKNRHNKLTHNTEGYAIENYYFDDRYRTTRTEYLNKYKFPVVSSKGYSSENLNYDLNDNIITKIYRDEANALIEDENGVAIYNMVYNRNGEIVSYKEFGADNINLDSIQKGPFCSTTNPYSDIRFISIIRKMNLGIKQNISIMVKNEMKPFILMVRLKDYILPGMIMENFVARLNITTVSGMVLQ